MNLKVKQVQSKYRTNNFFGLTDSYSVYKKLDISKKVKKSLYLLIIKDFMLFIRHTLIRTGEVTLPHKCGLLRVEGHKTIIRFNEKGELQNKIDYGATNKLWAEDPEAKAKRIHVYHLNEHSNGYYYTIRWSKYKMPLKNKNNYVFKGCRTLNRQISKAITNQKEYLLK